MGIPSKSSDRVNPWAKTRFWAVTNRIPFWAVIPASFFGAVFRDHKVVSTVKTHSSLIENLGSVILAFGLILIGLKTYHLVSKWQKRRGVAPTLKVKIVKIVLSLIAIVAIFGVFDSPASALRWKLDPSAKVQYLASVKQATQDVIDIQNRNKAYATRVALEKQQEMAKKVIAQKKIQDEVVAKAKAAEAKAAVTQALADKEASKREGPALKTDTVTLKNIKGDLVAYLNTWANFTAGNSPVSELQFACDLLHGDYQATRSFTSQTISSSSAFSEFKDSLEQTQGGCSYSMKRGDLTGLRDAAQFALASRNLLERLLSEIK